MRRRLVTLIVRPETPPSVFFVAASVMLHPNEVEMLNMVNFASKLDFVRTHKTFVCAEFGLN